MARRARIVLPGVPMHIIQRGNNRSACFRANPDYVRYLHELAQLARLFRCQVHAYVLMTNHVHLLLTPEGPDSVSMLMKHLGQRYVQYVNRTYHRSGTLWEGRFRSCVAQEDSYVLCCYRYIELNPVRAGLASHPRDYRWSSYRCNAEGFSSRLVTPHECYRALATSAVDRRAAYRELFHAAVDEPLLDEIRSATNGNFILGSDAFRRLVEEAIGRRATRGLPGRRLSLPAAG